MTSLVRADVQFKHPYLALVYEVSDPLPQHGHWTLATTFTSSDGGPIDHVGFKYVDGEHVGTWTFDLSDSKSQQNHAARPRKHGNTWTLFVPTQGLRPTSGTWRAALDLNGEDRGAMEGEFIVPENARDENPPTADDLGIPRPC